MMIDLKFVFDDWNVILCAACCHALGERRQILNNLCSLQAEFIFRYESPAAEVLFTVPSSTRVSGNGAGTQA